MSATIYASLTRPPTSFGCENLYTFNVVIFCVFIYLASADALGLGIAIFIASVLLFVGRFLRNKDPQLIAVLLRHLHHKDFYADSDRILNQIDDPKEFKIP